MSLGGSYQDRHLEMFKDTLFEQLQQRGSHLEQTTMSEMMKGKTNYFDVHGSMTSYEKTSRNQLKTFQNASFERRPLEFEFNAADIILDVVDLADMVSNPESSYVQAMVMELGRKKDEIILNAIKGTAVAYENGVASNKTLTSTVAVNDHTYDTSVSGANNDVGLTSYKLKNALKKLAEAHVDVEREEIFCVAPMNQIMNLSTSVELTSKDYRSKTVLESPGVDKSLSGYLGITFIRYEDTGLDSNNDELVYVYSKGAIGLGIRKPLTVEKVKLTERTGNPESIEAMEEIGATRLFEGKVVQIACDPTTLISAAS